MNLRKGGTWPDALQVRKIKFQLKMPLMILPLVDQNLYKRKDFERFASKVTGRN